MEYWLAEAGIGLDRVEAWRCFRRTEMGALVIGSFLLERHRQPRMEDDGSWKTEFELD